ncbi:hypothetical protein BMS3Abin05_02328 [bacterium BMS3Abin05]|nr:hypothetical protein BMS3Abin05_02328 [bacterium BMS3Abin05]
MFIAKCLTPLFFFVTIRVHSWEQKNNGYRTTANFVMMNRPSPEIAAR